MEHIGLDFDDALQYFVCKKLGINFIVSFDRDFNGLGIKRIEPAES
jgi:predicted nucleic acid-binding protein